MPNATSIAMSKDEREAFLADVHVGVFSIPREGQGPLTCPVWYQYEPGGEIVVVTPADSRKAKLLRPGARVSFCVQQEEMPPKYVSVEGTVLSLDPADIDADVRPLTHRYLGKEVGDNYVDATRTGDQAQDEVVIRIRPERWLSADFSKRFAQA